MKPKKKAKNVSVNSDNESASHSENIEKAKVEEFSDNQISDAGPSQSNAENEEEMNEIVLGNTETNKKRKPGIIYLSTVPYFMSVRRIRELLIQYGEIGRIFLKRETRIGQDGKRRKEYSEGWIEFLDKKIAKRVALCCNNAPVGGKRRAKYKEALWNMKYLNRFQWMHLDEQLRYEKEVRKQRMRTEIAQAKREASFFSQQVEKGRNLKKLEETVLKKGGLWEKYQRQIPQKKQVKQKEPKNKDELLDLILGE